MNSNTIANRRERTRNRGADPARRAGNKHRPTVATAHRVVILREPDDWFRAIPPGSKIRATAMDDEEQSRGQPCDTIGIVAKRSSDVSRDRRLLGREAVAQTKPVVQI
jgi:hypothetical protein